MVFQKYNKCCMHAQWFGGLVWIPPLPPIGFGVGSYVFWMMILGVAVTVLGIVLFVVLRNRT